MFRLIFKFIFNMAEGCARVAQPAENAYSTRLADKGLISGT